MLLEREHALARLTALLAEAAGGSGRLVFLCGEAGVGKTSLVRAFTGGVDGVAVRAGGCDSLATPAALGPFVDALPELTDVIEQAADVDRVQLFRRLRLVFSAAPTLLVLEDVHWADEATLDLLRFLGRRLSDLPLLVVATFREDEVGSDHPLTIVLGDLATSPGVTRVRLAPLTRNGVRQLVEAAGSPLQPDELHRRTGGNPFYVTEALAAGQDSLPATVRDAVVARAARLSLSARQVLGAAAVLGRRADLQQLVAVSGQPAQAADECVARGMLVETAGGLAFRHELARLAVEHSLSPVSRAALHARALTLLRSAGIGDDRRLVHHAVGSGDREAVRQHAPRAAAHAARLGAHREAADLYRLALRSGEPADDEAGELFTALSYECYLTDQVADALAARRTAMELAERAGQTRGVGEHQRWISRLSWFLGRNADADAYAVRAIETLEPLGDGRELAMAYSNMSQLRMLEGDTTATVAWGERAIDLARRLGDRETEIHALNNVGAVLGLDEDPRGERLLTQSLELALLTDAPEHAARAYTNLSSGAVTARRLAEADRYLAAGIGYCEARDLGSWTLYMTAWQARSHAEQGRYAQAEEWADRVLRHPRVAPVTRMTALAVAGQLSARRGDGDAGRLDEALRLAEPTGEEQRIVPVAVARAEAAWLQGRVDDVASELERGWSSALPHRNPWTFGELCWWFSVAGEHREPPVGLPRPFALMLAGAWQAAAADWQACGCPLWSAYALAGSDDLADGRRALGIVDELGLPAVREALLRNRHAAGLPVPRGPRTESQANPSGLTARELEVLHLLAEGLSNAETAQRLYLSEKTVGHHVSAVLRKLGEPSRGRAVTAARRRGIVPPA